MNDIGTLLIWCLPASGLKNRLLRMVGHAVDPTAVARANLVWRVKAFEMGPGSRIGPWNMIKNLRAVRLEAEASIGRLNVVSAHPLFARHYSRGARLVVGERAYLTSRHQLDCSGGVSIGALSALAGHQSRVMTHSIDLERDAQAAYPVVIGERSFVGARCLLLGGAELPARSVLAAGSVLVRGRVEERPAGLYAGVPAKYKGPIEGGKWFDRASRSTAALYVPDTDEIIDEPA